MDSEHRHELKTNELADFIGHAPQYLRDNAMMISVVVLVVIAAIAARAILSIRNQSHFADQVRVTTAIEALATGKGQSLPDKQGLATTDGILGAIGSLEAAAAQSKDPAMKALALIKCGDGLRAELHYRSEPVTDASVADVIAQAQTAYERALDKAKGTVIEAQLTAMAQMGLGLCAEELGDYDKADGIYKQIANNEQLKGTVFPVQAKLRIETMQDSKGFFVFVDAPPPGPDPKLQGNNPALRLPGLPPVDLSTPPGSDLTLPGIPGTFGTEDRIKIKPAAAEPQSPQAKTATTDTK